MVRWSISAGNTCSLTPHSSICKQEQLLTSQVSSYCYFHCWFLGIFSVALRQTAVTAYLKTAYFSSKQLLLFAFEWYSTVKKTRVFVECCQENRCFYRIMPQKHVFPLNTAKETRVFAEYCRENTCFRRVLPRKHCFRRILPTKHVF